MHTGAAERIDRIARFDARITSKSMSSPDHDIGTEKS